jgi:hypothetical protein
MGRVSFLVLVLVLVVVLDLVFACFEAEGADVRRF